jgi:SAM-dependent methyltransferase
VDDVCLEAVARTFRAVSFSVSAEAYDRFMGRYSVPLAPLFADLAGVVHDQRVLDVGCGPGALTAELVRRLGAGRVAAVDPSSSFVAAARERHPDVDVRIASAERLPFPDRAFDAALAQLVVHFMADPVAGLREMRRVTRTGGVVAACVWDFAEGGSPLSLFWRAVRELDPSAAGEAALPGTRRGQLGQLLREAGLTDVEEGTLRVNVQHESFAQWWDPFTLGVGPAGAYVSSLDARARAQLEQRCRSILPEPPCTVTGRAWAARGRVPGRRERSTRPEV